MIPAAYGMREALRTWVKETSQVAMGAADTEETRGLEREKGPGRRRAASRDAMVE